MPSMRWRGQSSGRYRPRFDTFQRVSDEVGVRTDFASKVSGGR
jgi:hypothetical protein